MINVLLFVFLGVFLALFSLIFNEWKPMEALKTRSETLLKHTLEVGAGMLVHVFPSLPQVMVYDGLMCFAGNLMLLVFGCWFG